MARKKKKSKKKQEKDKRENAAVYNRCFVFGRRLLCFLEIRQFADRNVLGDNWRNPCVSSDER